ncbi:DUF6973 domain-containing protein [Streptomyces sp. NPDC050560]|uniref:DUF6973 domain-containing protein n=1 Tax=Streptomyces sp. NPDC050560 TaxID=3365630 RepID=UPI0037A628ED
MNLFDLRDARLESLATAVEDLGEMVKKLKTLQADAKDDLKGLADRARWQGVNAKVGKGFIHKTAREFVDAHREAASIHNILKDTHDELVAQRGLLHDALADADKQNLSVVCSGNQIIVTAKSSGPNGPDPNSYSDKDLKAMLHRVQDIMTTANEIDSSAASALRGYMNLTHVGFSSTPKIKDREDAARREKIRQQGFNLDEEFRKKYGPPISSKFLHDLHPAEVKLAALRPEEVGTVSSISLWAQDTAKEKYPHDEDKQNAYRHVIWQARLTRELGPDAAEMWGDAHEADAGADEQQDHRADLVNNVYARNLGRRVAAEYPHAGDAPGPPHGFDAEHESKANLEIMKQAERYAESPRAARDDEFSAN